MDYNNSFYQNNIFGNTGSMPINSLIYYPPEFEHKFRKNWPTIDVNKFYSEEEALSILFADRRRIKEFEKVKILMDRDLIRRIKEGKVNRIRGYRVLRKLTQKQLSRMTGIPQPSIARMEKSGYEPQNPTLKKLASVLNVDFKELIP
ncbi:MAG: hypothetical protein A2Z43_02660 [Syntrophobacterales bacterium RBG_19FT_COMBO_59_10]|nr:MAG: hypothetical protein A2Z43_02660 [Syntrophobacterales bacterium RBG_19FT_COMBO_59_10]